MTDAPETAPDFAVILNSHEARTVEALIFASAEPVSEAYLSERLPADTDLVALLTALRLFYRTRGVNLVRVDGHWAFRTASDLSFALRQDEHEVKKLSRAALEVLSIIAYHQPVTRAEIEDIRGVSTNKGTLDVLVLKALTWGPRHGYAVARWIEDVTQRTLQVEEGALYHALHRLEKRGWLDSEWGVAETNRRAKYYTLTPAGRLQFAAQTATWTRYAEAVFMALGTA